MQLEFSYGLPVRKQYLIKRRRSNMKPMSAIIALLCVGAAGVWMGYSPSPLAAQGPSSPRKVTAAEYAASLPKDVYPDSRGRLPLVKREDLDEQGKKDYDSHLSQDSSSLAGLAGPGGLRLHASPANLRGAGLGRRLQELARLVVSREMDQVFEWTVHEPRALEQGLGPAIIDVVRYRKPLTGVGEKEAAIIQLGREVFGKHKVSSETFARAYKLLGDRNLVDLCDLMGSYATTAILLHTVDVRLPYDRKPLLPVP
jgi:4-carboxymuconolactone decarboxylase